jgi:hypothetical protein
MRVVDADGKEDTVLSVPPSKDMTLKELLNLPTDTLGFAEQVW